MVTWGYPDMENEWEPRKDGDYENMGITENETPFNLYAIPIITPFWNLVKFTPSLIVVSGLFVNRTY